MPIMARTRIGRYFEITVPREVRKLLRLRESDVVEWILKTECSIIKKHRGE